jgi:putative sterol carrier protein
MDKYDEIDKEESYGPNISKRRVDGGIQETDQLQRGLQKSGCHLDCRSGGFGHSAKPEIGINEDFGMWLDLHQGVCREAKKVGLEEAQKAPFCIIGDYTRWKQVIKKELEPVKGMMQGKLKLKGDLPTIVRYIKASQELVECTTRIETKFLDE